MLAALLFLYRRHLPREVPETAKRVAEWPRSQHLVGHQAEVEAEVVEADARALPRASDRRARARLDPHGSLVAPASATASSALAARSSGAAPSTPRAVALCELARAEEQALSRGGDTHARIPTDVRLLLQGLQARNEQALLERAAGWCDEHEPGSLKDIAGDRAVSESFVGALGLAMIPEKKLRRALLRVQVQGTGVLVDG